MLKPFFFWSGVVAWGALAVLGLCIVFQEVLHPALRACSFVRFSCRWHLAHKTAPTNQILKAIPGALWVYYLDLRPGRGDLISYTMADGSRWKGIGDWDLKRPKTRPTEPTT